MSLPRGRKRLVDEDAFVSVISSYKNEIIDNGRVVSKQNNVWEEIAAKLGNKYAHSSLYPMVKGNKYGILDKLLVKKNIIGNNESSSVIEEQSSIDKSNNMSYDNDASDITEEEIKFDFVISKEEMDGIVEKKYYARTTKTGRKKDSRLWNIFRPGIYQYFISKKIWDTTNLKCGFLIEHSYINLQATSAKIQGHCKCGSSLNCSISQLLQSKDYIAHCTVSRGLGKCGKRPLTNPIRHEVCKELEGTSVEAYRAGKAKELMQGRGDDIPEPPILFSKDVLYTAKKEELSKQYLNPDPFMALQMMKYGEYANCIQDIGYHPFYAHYGTNEQLQVYKKLFAQKDNKVCICIDSTGGVVKKIRRLDNNVSKHIFLHIIAVNTNSGQFTLAHMLSEDSHTPSITYWLLMWLRSGAPIPHMSVTDWSRALLNAVTISFTNFKSIDDYADALRNEDQYPYTYIRIDVAHTLKKYSRYLSVLRKRLKTFYLACIGELIKSTDVNDAKELITNIFIVCSSEMEGRLPDGTESICEKAKSMLLARIADVILPDDLVDTQCINPDDYFEEVETCVGATTNEWTKWGKNILKSVRNNCNDEGDRMNAHIFEKFADYLLKDITLLPLWTNICARQYSYNRDTASSAPVEGEFNKIKNFIFKPKELPMRVDLFIEKHLRYLQGKILIVNAALYMANEEPDEDSIPNAVDLDNGLLLDEVPSYELTQRKSECPACVNNQPPEGGHLCMYCNKAVHALNVCSLPVGEEGYGQKRICFRCVENKREKIGRRNLPKILSCKTLDNDSQITLIRSNEAVEKNVINNIIPAPTDSVEIHDFSIKNMSQVSREQTGCKVCANKVASRDRYACLVCDEIVHCGTDCSEPYGNDEDGIKRICRICSVDKNAKNILALKEADNWRNLGQINEKSEEILKRKLTPGNASDKPANKHRRALYLGDMKSKIRDMITIEKHLSIPVLKNGSNRDIGLPIINEKKVSVQDTCAFDSLFQLFLAATFDFEKMFHIVRSLERTEKFFELVKHVKEKGIVGKTYQMRANILKDYYEIKEHPTIPGLFVMLCEQNVGFLAERLFSVIPSYVETINCSEGCHSSEESFTFYEVPITVLHENLEQLLVRICEEATKDSPCTTNKCTGVRKTKHVIGDIVIVQIDNVLTEIKVLLKDIPRYITIPGDTENKLQMMGLVDYTCYRKTRKEEESQGHYTTFALRRDGVWCRYDDLHDTNTYKFNKNQRKVVPILLLLIKIKND